MKSIWETVFKSNEYMLLNYGFVLPKGNSLILIFRGRNSEFQNFQKKSKSEHVHLGAMREKKRYIIIELVCNKKCISVKNLKIFARQNIIFSSFKMQFNLVFDFGRFLIPSLFRPNYTRYCHGGVSSGTTVYHIRFISIWYLWVL